LSKTKIRTGILGCYGKIKTTKISHLICAPVANFGSGITRHFLQIPACVNCALGPGMLLQRKRSMVIDAFTILNIQKCFPKLIFYEFSIYFTIDSSRRVIPNPQPYHGLVLMVIGSKNYEHKVRK